MRRDPRLLRLFRVHKDPTILVPQFVAIHNRMKFLYEPELKDFDTLTSGIAELLRFIRELEMGTYYSRKCSSLLALSTFCDMPWSSDQPPPPTEGGDFEAAQTADAREVVARRREEVEGLIVELLRFQHWRACREADTR